MNKNGKKLESLLLMMDAKFKKNSSALKSLSEKHHLLPRFADYFAICGLDVDLGLEAELYTGNTEDFFVAGS